MLQSKSNLQLTKHASYAQRLARSCHPLSTPSTGAAMWSARRLEPVIGFQGEAQARVQTACRSHTHRVATQAKRGSKQTPITDDTTRWRREGDRPAKQKGTKIPPKPSSKYVNGGWASRGRQAGVVRRGGGVKRGRKTRTNIFLCWQVLPLHSHGSSPERFTLQAYFSSINTGR